MKTVRWLGILTVAGMASAAQALDLDKPDTPKAAPTASAPDWRLAREDSARDIRTYTRMEDDKPYRSFRVESTIHAPLSTVGKVLADFQNYGRWYWQVTQVRLLKQVSANEFYLYLVHNAPVGLPDHDAILQVTVEPAGEGHPAAKVQFHARPDYLPPAPGLIRMQAEEITLTLTPTADNQVKLEASGYFNPGGNEPVWAANLVQRNAPYTMAAGLERLSRLSAPTGTPAFLLTASR